jgi:hypothetical protein
LEITTGTWPGKSVRPGSALEAVIAAAQKISAIRLVVFPTGMKLIYHRDWRMKTAGQIFLFAGGHGFLPGDF